MKKNTAVIHATPQKFCTASRGKLHFAHTLIPSFHGLLFLLAAGIFLFSCEDTKLSSEASITSLTLTVGSTDYEITFTNREGTIKVPYATKFPVKARVTAVTLSAKATGVKVGNEVTLSDSEPLILTVTAEDKTTTQEYTVNVEKAPASSEASITSLTLTVGEKDYEVTFTGTQDTLRVVPYGMPIPTTAVGVKEIKLSFGAMSDAGNELSVTDNAVTITVTAADGKTKKTYTVTLGFTTAGMTSFTFEVTGNESMALDTADHKRIVGMIDQQAKTITFAQQSAYVYLDKLKATFEVSEEGAAVQVAGVTQTSGTTEQDFTSPVSYVVRAEGTETTYRVTLTKSTLATIPDDPFRTKLKEFVPAAFTGDQLDITHSDVTNYSNMYVSAQYPAMTSLKGIEFFTALKGLYCSKNHIRSLDISKNTALTTLDCSINSLQSLDVRKNTALEKLECDEIPKLASLDVRENTALKSLECRNTGLTSLDVSKNTALTKLLCSDNSLQSLDVRANTALTELQCNSNRLSSLDVSKNTALTILYCDVNSLTSLDMTGMRSIAELGIGTGTGTDNPLLATLRVNTAVQDRGEIITMKTARGTDLTITTVNNEGDVVCNDYDPSAVEDKCNQAP